MVSWNDVAGWVSSGAAESEVLEFKAKYWADKDGRSAGEELAKDVAGLLNHRGGTIVVGVGESGGGAAGFAGAPLPDNAEQRVQQALDKHLAPRTAAGSVSVYPLGGDWGGAARSVLVVEVRAWPHGPVAVRGEGASYRIPRRRGAHTEDIPWEDAMRDMTATHRRNWLRFTEWMAHEGTVGVFLGSAIRSVRTDGGAVALPLVTDEPFAELADVRVDAVRLRMIRTSFAAHRAAVAELRGVEVVGLGDEMKFVGHAILDALDTAAWGRTSGAPMLAVPFELIRAAWAEPVSGGLRVELVLNADVVFARSRWMLRPTGV